MNTNVTMIPVAQLHPHPDNPRKDLGDITELTASIVAAQAVHDAGPELLHPRGLLAVNDTGRVAGLD